MLYQQINTLLNCNCLMDLATPFLLARNGGKVSVNSFFCRKMANSQLYQYAITVFSTTFRIITSYQQINTL